MKRVVELEITIRTQFETEEGQFLTKEDFYKRLTQLDMIRITNHRITREEFKN